jgi:hypothetical protein
VERLLSVKEALEVVSTMKLNGMELLPVVAVIV